MAKQIEVNGKKYKVVPMNLNTVCNLDDFGVSMEDYGKKHMSFTRAYVALCMDAPLEVAGNEIEQHMINGGTLEDIVKAITAEVEASDFFRALSKNA